MTVRRRARQRLVASAALILCVTLVACTDGTQVAAGPDQGTPLATAVPTTAPAVPTAPEPALPSPVVVPTSVPVVVEPTEIEVTATPVPPTTTPEAAALEPLPAGEPPSPSAPAPTTAPPPTDSQEVRAANGAEIYTLTCARCHGENGLGSAQYSASLIGVGSNYSSQGMIAELTTGHPVTFGFADRLSEGEIAAVVAYAKSAFP